MMSKSIGLGLGTGWWRRPVVRAAAIMLAVLVIYAPTYRGDWLWDDEVLLTRNLTVQHRISPDPRVPPDSLRSLAKLWFDPDGADYFPLSYTALWAQWPFFGLESNGYHVTTILLHIAGALLLWALLAQMKIPGAWLSGLLFAIHPVCVESVAWVSETKNTLSLPLFLIAAICWVGQDDEADTAKRQRLYGLSILCFLLAMFAKTSVVAFPVVTLLYAWWKRGTVTKNDLILAAPLFAISIALGLLTMSYQWGRAIGEEKILIGDFFTPGGFLSRLAIAGLAVFHYLASIAWPVNLLPIYPRWEVDPPQAWMFLAWPVILGAAWWMWKNRDALSPPHWGRHAIFAFGFFLLMVAPVLGFVTISYMRITWVADHFIYVPMIGIIALACAGAVYGFKRPWAELRPTLVTAGALVAVAFALLSYATASHWADEDRLWEHTLARNPAAWQAHSRLGSRKLSRGDVDGAHAHFQSSTRLRPDLPENHNNLGMALAARARGRARRGDAAAADVDLAAAIDRFSEACRLAPLASMSRLHLADTLTLAGRFAEADKRYAELLTTAPRNPIVLHKYGLSLLRQDRKDEAIEQFRLALSIAPHFTAARDTLALALGEDDNRRAEEPD
jgi:Flp pilus assembly protein TadD